MHSWSRQRARRAPIALRREQQTHARGLVGAPAARVPARARALSRRAGRHRSARRSALPTLRVTRLTARYRSLSVPEACSLRRRLLQPAPRPRREAARASQRSSSSRGLMPPSSPSCARGAEHVIEDQVLHRGRRDRPLRQQLRLGADEQRTVLGPIGRAAMRALDQRRVQRDHVHQIAEAEHLLRQPPARCAPWQAAAADR